MSIPSWIILGILWVVSLLAVGAAASAQAQRWRPIPEPRVLSGPDVGFRVEGLRGEVPTGSIIVRVNGEWVDAAIGPGFPDRLLK
jgi:hypothetical protein